VCVCSGMTSRILMHSIKYVKQIMTGPLPKVQFRVGMRGTRNANAPFQDINPIGGAD